MMNARDRVLRCLQRKQVDRIPFEFSLTPKLKNEFFLRTGSDDVVEYYDFDMRSVEPGPTKKETDFRGFLPELPAGTVVDEWGVASIPGSTYHFTRRIYPLANMQTVRELHEYPFADWDADYRFTVLKQHVSAMHSAGYFVDGWVGHIFEWAWYMRGLDELLVDFYENHDFANYLLDRITNMNTNVARKMAEADCDMIRLGDDVGTQRGMMMSPEIWRRFLKPRLARVIAGARSIKPNIHVWYHSDGNIGDIVEDLIEVGVDVLNPIQPECLDPLWVKSTYGDRLSLWGTIGTQRLMPFGTPREIKDKVQRNIESLGYNGGLVLAPTHVLEPDVPWENIEAFVNVCKNH